MPTEAAVKRLIWERIRERIQQFPGDPASIDARKLAADILKDLPDSGLTDNDVALEFHRIRRAMRDRPNAG